MVSSSDTVYVIGNYVVNVYTSPLIASFKDNIWKEVGNLYLVRRNAAAILYDSQVMIVGGQSYKQPEFTEIWKEDFSSGNTTEPILPASHYERITLLLVDEGFCEKSASTSTSSTTTSSISTTSTSTSTFTTTSTIISTTPTMTSTTSTSSAANETENLKSSNSVGKWKTCLSLLNKRYHGSE